MEIILDMPLAELHELMLEPDTLRDGEALSAHLVQVGWESTESIPVSL